jgi:hypothetical protein
VAPPASSPAPAAPTSDRAGAVPALRLVRAPSPRVARRRDQLFVAVLAAGVVAGLVLRIVMANSVWGVLDSDEAVVGLMARSIARGDIPTLFWGQGYGGTTEAFVLAGWAGLFGWSTFAIRVVAVGLAATATLLVWRIGRRTIGPWPGAAAALFFWLWPAPYVFWSLKLRGFYWTALVAGLVFTLCALRLAERPNRRDAVVAGLAAGIGWWSTPQIAVYAVPVVIWLLARHRDTVRPLLTAGLPAAVIGALPWLAYNVRHSFVALDPPELAAGASGSYLEHLGTFAGRGLPVAVGARLPWTEQWLPGGALLYAAALVAVAVVIAVRRPPLLPVVLVAFPFVHALSPWSNYIGEGRYLVYYAPFLALAVAGALRQRVALATVAVGLFAVTLVGLDRTAGLSSPYSGDRRVPESLAPLVADLDRRQIRHVYADYWIGYRLAYETDERIIPEGFRNAEWSRRVDRATHVAYVYMEGDPMADDVRREMRRIDQDWVEHRVAGFQLLIPDRSG